jgi:hypothetical protein
MTKHKIVRAAGPALGVLGFVFAGTSLLTTGCSEPGTPVSPTAVADPSTYVGAEGSHGDHSAKTGLEDELAQVRQLTAKFHRLEAAADAGYELGYVNGSGVRIITGCIAHPTAGAMGYHYFNKALIDDLVVDPLKPEGLVYAPDPDGRLRLAALEYVVPGLASNPPGVSEPPTVFDRKMVILVPEVGFYTLHAWVWAHNPAGMFAHWNPKVVCP